MGLTPFVLLRPCRLLEAISHVAKQFCHCLQSEVGRQEAQEVGVLNESPK
jgi:hypothetical protein